MNNSSNYNYPCGLPPDFPPSFGIPPAVNYVQAAIALVTGIVGLSLNIFVLFIIIKYRSLQQRLMYIAIQISIMEITYLLLIPPAIFVSGIAREWLLGDAMCNILGIVNDGFAYFRFMMTFILTLDRFISVFSPFFYERHAKRILFSLLGLVYFTTFVRVFLPIEGVMGCYAYVGSNKICTAYSGCSLNCYYFVVVSITLIVAIGAFMPFGMYMILFCKAYRLRKATMKTVPQELPLESQEGEARVKPNVRKESFHVTITMFILLMSVIGGTSPVFILYAVQFVADQKHPAFFILIMLVGRTSFNSIPVVDAIAIMRNKQFRESARKFFAIIKEKLHN